MAPRIASATIASAGGSVARDCVHTTCATSAPRPAPMSAIATKYAKVNTTAPRTPPTMAARIIPIVFVDPIIELAISAPRMNP